MDTTFTGKKLLVIGGTSGIGLETARMVLQAGGSVVLTAAGPTSRRRPARPWPISGPSR